MLSGFKDLYKLLDDSQKAIETGAIEGLKNAGARVKNAAGGKLGTYQAASGSYPSWQRLKPETVRRKGREAPLTDTGRLRQAIRAETEDDGGGVVYVGAAVGGGSYATVHEFGSAAGGIPARPYLRPAVYENQEEIKEDIADAIKEGLRGLWP